MNPTPLRRGDGGSRYEPSPHPVDLPRVRRAPSRPVARTIDVPPTPLRRAVGEDDGAGVDAVDRGAADVDADRGRVGIEDVSSRDASASATTDAAATTATKGCVACGAREGRYACPKCRAPYCSAACYRAHGAGGCSEAFFRDRVLGSCRGDEEGIRSILTRMHGEIGDGLDDAERREEWMARQLREGEEGGHLEMRVDGGGAEAMSDEDLAELAGYVLQMDEEGGESDEILKSIPPRLLRAFERAAGHLLPHDGLFRLNSEEGVAADDDNDEMSSPQARTEAEDERVERPLSSPWWLPGEGDDVPRRPGPSLDERILSLPPLRSLRRTDASADRPTGTPSVACNVLEVLFAASLATRSDVGADGKAALLLAQSRVLSSDARYDSAREAMMAGAERLAENAKAMCSAALGSTGGDDASWDVLASDAATLSCNRRYVLRMLFEALDCLETHLKATKSNRRRRGSKNEEVSTERAAREDGRRMCKLAAKKIEYFLSWASAEWSPLMGREMSEEVSSYVADWRSDDVPQEESPMERLIRGIRAEGAVDEDEAGALAGEILEFKVGDRPSSMSESPMILVLDTTEK